MCSLNVSFTGRGGRRRNEEEMSSDLLSVPAGWRSQLLARSAKQQEEKCNLLRKKVF